MAVSQAAARIYAKAVFDVGVDSDSLQEIADELHAVRDAINGLDPELRTFFELPQLPRDDKWQVVSLAFEGKVGRTVLGLLRVLVDKRREPLLGAIVAEFDDLVDTQQGRLQAEVISAQPLDPELAEALRTAMEQQTQRQVVILQRVDPNLIGGIRVSLGDTVVDGTVRRALSDMRQSLTRSLA